jgi:hypothetical protein
VPPKRKRNEVATQKWRWQDSLIKQKGWKSDYRRLKRYGNWTQTSISGGFTVRNGLAAGGSHSMEEEGNSFWPIANVLHLVLSSETILLWPPGWTSLYTYSPCLCSTTILPHFLCFPSSSSSLLIKSPGCTARTSTVPLRRYMTKVK